MPLIQQQTGQFDQSSPAPPPPYTSPQAQVYSAPIQSSAQLGPGHGQSGVQHISQKETAQFQQQSSQQSPSQLSHFQQHVVQQQHIQYPNMTSDQQQQVQTIMQNMPPEKLQAFQHQAQQMMYPQQLAHSQQPTFIQTTPSGLFSSSKPTIPGSHSGTPTHKDEKKTGSVQRFFGDTLVGRVARASVQTATSAMKMPASLSPWGDNNPVTLPNVRYRDAVLFTTFAFVGAPIVDGMDSAVTGMFGVDSFIAEIVSSGSGSIAASTVLKYGVFQIVEQAIDKGIIEHMIPEEEMMIQTTSMKSLQVGIKHKLMGVDADLRFVGIYPSRNQAACEKGWFCPYLFASARTPVIPRANDFAIAQFFGPFLGGDYALAHKLLAETSHVISLCDADPTHDIGVNRLVLLFTGIAPYRANMWSTSRRPGCGTVIFHLMNGCPALVLPVTSRAPILAWSPWTLSQMRGAQYATSPQGTGPGGYSAEWQHEQICEWLDSIISLPHLKSEVQARYVDVLGRAVSLVINGALALEKIDKWILGKMDPERAGIVAFRY